MRVGRHVLARKRIADDAGVGTPCQVHTLERVGDAEHIVKGPVHGALTGAAGHYKRAIDIKQQQSVDQILTLVSKIQCLQVPS